MTLGARKEAKIRVGTPNAQGIYMRKPPLLPKAVNLRGKKKLELVLLLEIIKWFSVTELFEI